MIPLSKPVKVIESTDTRGVFEIEGLWPGYGVTVGNSLRRVLLSSLQGAAVTQVKIKGAKHEFDTLEGMAEDVLTLLLNIKQLRFTSHSEEPQTAELNVKGQKKVTGKDIKLPSTLELVSKDAPLATLTDKKAELAVEFTVEKGVGYVSAEARRKGKQEIGTIDLDAIFTPVQKVSYRTEHMRVGERTDFDRVHLEVTTDGTLSPEAALAQAAEILVAQFQLAGEGLSVQEAPAKKAPAKKTASKKTAAKKTPASKKK